MPIEVKLNDVIEALGSAMDEHAYYLDKRSGEIVLVTDDDIAAAENEEFESPDWQQESIAYAQEVLDDSEHLLPLPDKFEINEYKIMEDFCLALNNRQLSDELHRLIKGSGAFRRFKNTVRERDIEQDWYDFKHRALERIAIEWFNEKGLPYTRDDVIDATETTA